MTLTAGVRLGPYEVVELLGAGGMGEVYRARDPRLGRDVALKVLHEDVSRDPSRLKRFELEARAVAALNHPHILTVHDVGSHDGTPYVVSELLEGESLREVLSRRSPTQRQVLAWAVQAAQGLAAAHHKGIVHRDLKPENLFLTSDGRLKILDFGLAKLSATSLDSEELTASSPTKPGVLMGTVAYMSPEQVRAQPVDARSDLFSFGVVVYELLSRKHPFRRETAAATLGAILQETPPPLASLDPTVPRAVDGIVRRCLEKRREDRFQGAHDLGLALEAVLQAPTGSAVLEDVEERSPYPGLSSFTEKDASVFFGREAEVKALWMRIRDRKLLAVIGPSGVGKSSFVRAGVMPARPEGWAAACATPGSNPTLGLARALSPELAGDADAIGELLSGLEELRLSGETARVVAAVKRWRSRHAEAVLVVDQFEELFTLNPQETQARVAALLQRLATDADVHVVLSMRDDFLIRCSDHEPLAAVFSEITPLTALSRDGLGRAVVEPARKRGYRFEDDALVDEMVSCVEGVRGALPLLAFAVARLWETRDRERKLLTREAYREIAGVEGALAQHAEATMDRIGLEQHSTVREIFRNLVTAQGTRAVIDRQELLSAFPDRPRAETVLRQLIDARLLTTYEIEGKENEPTHHRVEVVHESLLKAWPRLVRWQAQDEEGAVLRDQLKQAAHLWDEKGRTGDLLWTGTAFREYELWRERYAGALTALEEDFARSMADKARRKRRLVRAAAAAVVLASIGVAIVIGVSRQRAVLARRQAEAAALRAEASKLLALAERNLQDDPTEALALATASLELSDGREARVFAVKALAESPPAFELEGGTNVRVPAFSPDGRLLAVAGHSEEARVWREDGGGPIVLPGHLASPRGPLGPIWASPSRLVVGSIWGPGDRAWVWSLPDGRLERTIELGGESVDSVPGGASLAVLNDRVLAAMPIEGTSGRPAELRLRSWPLPDGPPRELGRVPQSPGTFGWGGDWLYASGGTFRARALPVSHGSADTRLGEHRAEIVFVRRSATPHEVLTAGRDERRVWTLVAGQPPRVAVLSAPGWPDASGRWIVGAPGTGALQARSRDGWPAARPLDLRRSGSWYLAYWATHPTGDWLVATTGNLSRLTLWPLRRERPVVVDGYAAGQRPVAFSPDGRWLASSWPPGRSVRLWPLAPGSTAPRVLDLPNGDPSPYSLTFEPTGRFIFRVGNGGEAWIVPLDGRPARRLEGFSKEALLSAAAFSPSGRLVAAAFCYGRGEKALRVWDLETGTVQAFGLPQPTPPPSAAAAQRTDFEAGVWSLAFTGESTLYTGGHGGVRRWDLATGRHEMVIEAPFDRWSDMRIRPDKGVAVTRQYANPLVESCAPVVVHDLALRSARDLPAFGSCVLAFEIDASGQVLASGDKDGIVRVGRPSDASPHLLVGHKGVINYVAISPDLKWVASSGEDNTLRLWPMPDLAKPPLHTLPHDELVAKLHSLTNLRAVRDPKSSTGWSIELGPFPGWKNIPTW